MATRRRPVVWTPSAQAALDGALEYITQESLEGAQRVLRTTLDLAASLETLSGCWRVSGTWNALAASATGEDAAGGVSTTPP